MQVRHLSKTHINQHGFVTANWLKRGKRPLFLLLNNGHVSKSENNKTFSWKSLGPTCSHMGINNRQPKWNPGKGKTMDQNSAVCPSRFILSHTMGISAAPSLNHPTSEQQGCPAAAGLGPRWPPGPRTSNSSAAQDLGLAS